MYLYFHVREIVLHFSVSYSISLSNYGEKISYIKVAKNVKRNNFCSKYFF